MSCRRIVLSAALAATLAALPLAAGQAQYYYPACTPFPLSWPFCIAGAAVGTAATIATAPFAAASYYYPYSYRYYAPAYYYPRRHYRRRHHLH